MLFVGVLPSLFSIHKYLGADAQGTHTTAIG